MERLTFSRALLTVICLTVVTVLIISFNGGISVGGSNHFGQIPVVRRALDPNYLPGDFNIEIRQYHHRVFTWLVAGLSLMLGEDLSLIVIHLLGMGLLVVALWRLCRDVRLSPLGFIAVGLLLATNLIWTGKGLELNHFVGDADIMPPTFAHAFVLLAVGSLLRDRYRWAAVFAGLATLFHLQIGLICAAMIAPLYLIRLKKLGARKVVIIGGLFLVAAAPGLLDLAHMLRSGLLQPPSNQYSLAYYIDFRHPHHFELISAAAALWVGAHLLIQVVAYWFLRHLQKPEAAAVGKLAAMSLIMASLSIVHFIDYYLIKDDRIATIQFVRLSSLITVFGAICLVAIIGAGAEFVGARTGDGRIVVMANAGLIVIAGLWGVREARKPDSLFQFGISRYADQSSNWIDLCLWIKGNGPRDAVYLTPPGANGFTFLAERSNVADFKNNPDSGLYLAQWFERLRDLAGGELPNGRGFDNRQLFNQAYAGLSADQLLEVGKKYGAEFAVLPKAAKSDFEIVYRNNGYRLVKLPIRK